MANKILQTEYYYTSVQDQPGEAYKFLTQLADIGVNLLAFTAIPMGPDRTQFTLFPEDANKLIEAANNAGFQVDGPHPAILVQGDDELGALSKMHKKLFDAGVNVYASNAVTDGKGSFGYIVYVRPEEFDSAINALGI
ncbi:MAG: hypothetical protein PVF17_05765 [Ignavibacteria bacterium]|jgi:hypothetical protein